MQKSSLPTTLRSWGLPPPPTKRSQVHATKGHHSSSRSNKSSSTFASSSKPGFSRHSSSHSENNPAPSYATTRDTNIVYFKKHHKPSSDLTSSMDHPTPSDSILHSSTVYIGPPKRKVGRPSDGVGKSKSKKTSLASSRSSMGEDGLGSLLDQSLQQIGNPQAPTAIDPSLMQTLATLTSSGENAAILAALSAIDSNSSAEVPNTEAPNPALVDALKQLLSVVCSAANTNPQATPLQPPSNRLTKHEKSPVDDDVVILDKENVDPSVFRRKVDKDDAKSSSSTPHAPDTSRSRLLGNMENSSQSTITPAVVRKRRLSDFMDELEREHSNRSKGRSRENHPEKRTARSESASSAPLPKLPSTSHYRDMWGLPLTSPPRPTPSRENSTKSVNPPVPAASSPVRPLRSYSVPEWARTTTATQPRFSKEVEEQRQAMAAEAKRKKDVVKKDRKTAKRRGNDHVLDTASKASSRQSSGMSSGTRPSAPFSTLREPPKPITASSILHFPIIASDISLPPSSPSPSSSPTSIGMEPPQTPPRRDRSRSPSMPHNLSPSLFTPTPDFRMSERSGRISRPTENESQFSPTTGVAYAQKKWSQIHSTGENGASDADQHAEYFLSRELDSGLEDLDLTLNSLPIASSDVDDEPSQDYSEEELEFHREDAVQHWSGLPPSSPPPPTSPCLTPQDLSGDSSDRGDITDLSASYSECLPGSNGHVFTDSHHNPISFDDFSNLFVDLGGDTQFGEGNFSAFCEKSPEDGTGHLECSSIPSMGLADLSAEQNDLMDFDYSEFWQSVRPLVGQQVGGSSESPEVGMQSDLVDMGEIDHSKLAAAVQALFSGCLT
jgi:hypothetical protein